MTDTITFGGLPTQLKTVTTYSVDLQTDVTLEANTVLWQLELVSIDYGAYDYTNDDVK